MSANTLMTVKQARFINEYLIDGNGTQAAIRAGYGAAGARVAAHRLLTNVAISSLIEARQRADATRLAVDRDRVLAGLLEAVEMAREQLNPAGMVAGLREIAKLQGYYAPVQAQVEWNMDVTAERQRLEALSDADLCGLIEQSALALAH